MEESSERLHELYTLITKLADHFLCPYCSVLLCIVIFVFLLIAAVVGQQLDPKWKLKGGSVCSRLNNTIAEPQMIR